jgi:hypothetical protein
MTKKDMEKAFYAKVDALARSGVTRYDAVARVRKENPEFTVLENASSSSIQAHDDFKSHVDRTVYKPVSEKGGYVNNTSTAIKAKADLKEQFRDKVLEQIRKGVNKSQAASIVVKENPELMAALEAASIPNP